MVRQVGIHQVVFGILEQKQELLGLMQQFIQNLIATKFNATSNSGSFPEIIGEDGLGQTTICLNMK